MKTVWKYPIEINDDEQVIPGRIVHVERQDRILTAWAEVSPAALPEGAKTYRVFSTGHNIPDSATHVATVLDHPFVWHIYEVAQ